MDDRRGLEKKRRGRSMDKWIPSSFSLLISIPNTWHFTRPSQYFPKMLKCLSDQISWGWKARKMRRYLDPTFFFCKHDFRAREPFWRYRASRINFYWSCNRVNNITCKLCISSSLDGEEPLTRVDWRQSRRRWEKRRRWQWMKKRPLLQRGQNN